MLVGGFIAISYMLLGIITDLNLFNFLTGPLSKIGINKNISHAILSGFIEVTTGLNMLSCTNLSFKLSAIISSFLISFGGLSIHAQAYCYLKSFDLKYSHFLIQKITHAIISASVTFKPSSAAAFSMIFVETNVFHTSSLICVSSASLTALV